MHTAQADSYDKDSDPRYIRVVPTDSYGRINFANEGSASRDEGEAYLSHFNEKNSFCRSPSNFLRTLATRLCELRRLESAKKHAHSPTVQMNVAKATMMSISVQGDHRSVLPRRVFILHMTLILGVP